MNKQPILHIGILRAKKISFQLDAKFDSAEVGKISGDHVVSNMDGKLYLNEYPIEKNTLLIIPLNTDDYFTLRDVVIGINFHWQKKEDQSFKGALKFILDGDEVQAINVVDVEDYIWSVVASEMNPNAPLEFIKAHAIISRSWALAQVENSKNKSYPMVDTPEEKVIWYDKENHAKFDLCADDHCQRYQGLTRISNINALKAVKETIGEILCYKGDICDTRFSKCCGGISEDFDKVWQPKKYNYLSSVWDGDKPQLQPDITNEEDFQSWVNSTPDCFCNTKDQKVLLSVLNDYDQTTTDFFRWKLKYDAETIRKLIHKKTDIDFGEIIDLVPMERGKSGRLIRLKIVGSKLTKIIGKELEIRRVLSETHLYSSAFYISKDWENDSISFTLTGSGWGHGVGLCQIGAAAMSYKGYSYKEILLHYFQGAKITKLYKPDSL